MTESQVKKVLVVAGGEADPGILKEEAGRAGVIIAADGGAKHLLAAGLLPHLLVGDLDSLDDSEVKELVKRGVEVVSHPPEKDHTDTELALMHALGLRPEKVALVGALGSRWDHSLANLQLLIRGLEQGAEMEILAPGLRVFAIWKSAEIKGSRGDTLSLLPLGEGASGITLKGLKYPLFRGEFRQGRPLGVSNVFEEDTAVVQVERGVLLAFHFTGLPVS